MTHLAIVVATLATLAGPMIAPPLLVAAPTPVPTIPLDDSGFTDYVVKKLVIMRPNAKVTVTEPLSITIDTATVGLDRIQSFCRRVPSRCESVVTDFLSKALTVDRETASPDISLLRAALRTESYVGGIQAQTGTDTKSQILARPFAGELVEVCMIDSPAWARILLRNDYVKLNLSAEVAFERCRENIAKTVSLDSVKNLEPNEIGFLSGEYYESSAILLHDAWKPIAERFGGKLLVAVPEPNVVIYARGDDRTLVERMRLIVRQDRQVSERPLSAQIFRWMPQGWDVVPQ